MSSGRLGMIRPPATLHVKARVSDRRNGGLSRMAAHRVVIVGGGFGGLAAAKALRREHPST